MKLLEGLRSSIIALSLLLPAGAVAQSGTCGPADIAACNTAVDEAAHKSRDELWNAYVLRLRAYQERLGLEGLPDRLSDGPHALDDVNKLESLASNEGDQAQFLFVRATIDVVLEDFRKARDDLDLALKTDPALPSKLGKPSIDWMTGKVAVGNQDYANGAKAMTVYIDEMGAPANLDGNERIVLAEAYLQRAFASLRLKDYDGTIKDTEAATKLYDEMGFLIPVGIFAVGGTAYYEKARARANSFAARRLFANVDQDVVNLLTEASVRLHAWAENSPNDPDAHLAHEKQLVAMWLEPDPGNALNVGADFSGAIGAKKEHDKLAALVADPKDPRRVEADRLVAWSEDRKPANLQALFEEAPAYPDLAVLDAPLKRR